MSTEVGKTCDQEIYFKVNSSNCNFIVCVLACVCM